MRISSSELALLLILSTLSICYSINNKVIQELKEPEVLQVPQESEPSSLTVVSAPIFFDPFETYYECPKKPKLDCQDNWYRGCVCYKNGTCDTTWLNKCESCKNPKVYSVEAGTQCPGQNLSKNECFITHPFLVIDCFFPTTAPGCKCFTNRTCIETDVDNCRDCQTTFVESVAMNENCKGKKYQYFLPKACNITATNVRCSSIPTPGCLCYKNGTCVNTYLQNNCKACIQNDVASFNAGERCPTNAVNYQICPAQVSTSEPNCTDTFDWTMGCVCSKQYGCVQTRYSQCYACQNSDTILTVPNGACPFKKNIFGQQVFDN